MEAHKEWKICLTDLTYGREEEEAVLEVLRERWLTMGPRTARFERAVADLVGAQYAISLSSCTAGLYLLLDALKIGPGDEVIVPSLTFVATVNVIVNRGATPVFSDIVSVDRPLIDPRDVAAKLTPHTRAIFTVDYAGYPCDYDALGTIIADFEANGPAVRRPRDRRMIYLLEDAAHGIGGALDEERSLGNCGDAGVFSFFSNKNLATGEGGMLITNQASIAESVNLLRRHGLTISTWERHQSGPLRYDVSEPGWNFRPTEIQAALGMAQLAKLENNQALRHDLIRRYQAGLCDVPEVTVPFFQDSSWHFPACHIFPVLLPDVFMRDRIREALQIKGIQTSHHYYPIHLFEFYQRNIATARVRLPRTEDYAEREVTLPLHPRMTLDDVDWIVREIKEGLIH